jgi:hypothetical protein
MRIVFTILAFILPHFLHAQDLLGAWQSTDGENQMVVIFSAKHYAVTHYSLTAKTFTGTYGGSWKIENQQLTETQEFNTLKPEAIGDQQQLMAKITGNELQWGDRIFKRVDDGTPGALTGAWLITGRVTEQGKQAITPGARKTMKILSGTRFQWIAYNSETKEFFGTGGGTYTTANGKYTETIEFFSRDNSRVGMKLEFDFSLKEGNWHHSGKSSKGDPINEIWTKRGKIGI